jgi:hypothetical protein
MTPSFFGARFDIGKRMKIVLMKGCGSKESIIFRNSMPCNNANASRDVSFPREKISSGKPGT